MVCPRGSRPLGTKRFSFPTEGFTVTKRLSIAKSRPASKRLLVAEGLPLAAKGLTVPKGFTVSATERLPIPEGTLVSKRFTVTKGLSFPVKGLPVSAAERLAVPKRTLVTERFTVAEGLPFTIKGLTITKGFSVPKRSTAVITIFPITAVLVACTGTEFAVRAVTKGLFPAKGWTAAVVFAAKSIFAHTTVFRGANGAPRRLSRAVTCREILTEFPLFEMSYRPIPVSARPIERTNALMG